jgi:hypothetical protein
VLQRLEGLSDRETLRWHDLLWFVLSWALRRRPSHERQPLMDAARRSQVEDSHQQEIETMSETIEKTWEQEMFERGESHGRVLARREDLRILLEERFGSLPDRVTRKIEETDDIERLSQAIRQVLRMTSLEEFSL